MPYAHVSLCMEVNKIEPGQFRYPLQFCRQFVTIRTIGLVTLTNHFSFFTKEIHNSEV